MPIDRLFGKSMAWHIKVISTGPRQMPFLENLFSVSMPQQGVSVIGVSEHGVPSSVIFQHVLRHTETFLFSYDMLKIMSTEPDLNQRPRDI